MWPRAASTVPPIGVEPLRQCRRGRRRRGRDRSKPAAGHVGTTSVQPDQVVLARQLGTRQADEELPAGQATSALLDRADRLIDRINDTDPVDQLGDREHPGDWCQGRIRRADLDLMTDPTTTS